MIEQIKNTSHATIIKNIEGYFIMFNLLVEVQRNIEDGNVFSNGTYNFKFSYHKFLKVEKHRFKF